MQQHKNFQVFSMNLLKLYSNSVIILKHICLEYISDIYVLKLVSSDCHYFEVSYESSTFKGNVFSSPKARNLFKHIENEFHISQVYFGIQYFVK